jgi:isochorismate synthase
MLFYRFPGKNINRKSGRFISCTFDELEGFVVSNFNGSAHWRFVEEDISDLIYFDKKEPFEISKSEYILKANQLIQAIRSLGLNKVVYSRISSITFDTSLAKELFYALEEKYPHALIYLFSDSELGTWIGATPEILFEQHGKCGITTALAGTKKSTETSDWDEKEKLEQEYVVQFISETLGTENSSNIEVHGPYEYYAGPVKHLKTDFLFECSTSTSRKLINKLHPTPAVCGLPKDFASEIISQIEEHNRELYTGYIGEISEQQLKLFVNLRCASLTKGKMHFYLGGGFTKDSLAEREWAETENKKKTLSDLIDLL